MSTTVPHSTLFSLNGLTFPALVAGPPDGPVVLCLHGFPDTRHGFFPTSGASTGALLAAAGFRVVAPAMRGTEPECIPLDGDYTPDALASDVLAMIDALGGRAAVIGNDWGAFATYLAAARAPDKVTHAITLGIPHLRAVKWSPRLLWAARHMVAFQLPGHAAKVLRKDDLAKLDDLYGRWSPTWQRPADALAEVKNAYRKPGVIEAAIGPYVAMRKHLRGVMRELRAPIQVPTLALYGAADPSVPAAFYDDARKHFAATYRSEALPGVCHFVHREDPEGVARRAIEFLATHPQRLRPRADEPAANTPVGST